MDPGQHIVMQEPVNYPRRRRLSALDDVSGVRKSRRTSLAIRQNAQEVARLVEAQLSDVVPLEIGRVGRVPLGRTFPLSGREGDQTFGHEMRTRKAVRRICLKRLNRRKVCTPNSTRPTIPLDLGFGATRLASCTLHRAALTRH